MFDACLSGSCLFTSHLQVQRNQGCFCRLEKKKEKGGGGGEIPSRMKQHRKGVNNGQISDTYSKGHNHRGLTLAMTLPWCAREAVNTLITGSSSLHSTLWAFSWKRTLTKEHQPPTLLLKPLFHWVWDGISLWVSLPIYSDEMI